MALGTARVFFVLVCRDPMLAAFPERLAWASESGEMLRVRLFPAGLFDAPLLESSRLSICPPQQIGMNRSAMSPIADEVALITPGTCWKISSIRPSA